MATPDATIRLGQVGLEKDIQRAIQKVNARGGLNVKLNARSFTQPLGKITASADEFTKSIEASNARVIAFGASVGVINSISNAFKSLVQETIALEKRLAEVNVVLGANASQLNTFGKQLFNVARNTAQSFDTVSEAALEFSRQGLSMEETLKRTQDALILTRLTGLKAADSVKGLTATINSFATAGLNTAEIISKLAAVDVEFAVSSEDLINALSRAGAVAQDAGLDFDQLVAAVTSAQQITARGGAVIGNSFKTIFTRIQRSDTLDRLQELGIAVRDVRGETLPAMMILQQLAKTYDSLTDSTKSAVAEQVGGVFQINVLKAALKDLSSENSIYQRAVVTSASATDEAVRKNDQLNQTLSALSSQALVSIKELSAAVGQITVGPGIEKVLNMVNDLSQGAARLLDGEGIGSNLANGILKGLGTIISGPGLVLIGGLIGKLFIDVTTFAAKSFKNILGLNKAAVQQKALQDSILTTLQSNERINRVLENLEGNKAAQAKFLFNEVSRTTTEYNKQVGLARQLASTLGQMGVVGGSAGLALSGKRGRSQVTSARGFIPNYANATAQEMMDIKLGVGGVSKSERPVTLKGFDTGKEIVDMVANTGEVFVKNFAGSGGDAIFNPDMIRSFGMPQGAKKIRGSRGFIPNYALKPGDIIKSKSAIRKNSPLLGKNLDEAVVLWKSLPDKSPEQKKIGAAITNDRGGWGPVGTQRLKEARPSTESTSTTSAGKGPINFTLGEEVGQKYGVVLPVAGSNEKETLSVPQYKIVKGSPFPRGSKISVEDVNVARINQDPETNKYEEALKTQMTDAVRGLAQSLLPNSTQDFSQEDFRRFLDKSAKPQFLGRMFELALQYVSGQVVDNVAGGERFDFKDGLPKNVNQVFGLSKSAAKKKFDAKNSLEPDSQASMIEKIILEENRMADKKGLLKKLQDGKIRGKKMPISAAQGFLPNISIRASDLPALQDSIGREKAAGIPNFAIRVNRSPRLKSSGNPSGLAVTNVIDEPGGLKDVFRQKRVMSAASGFIPNFADADIAKMGSVFNAKPVENEIKKTEQQLADINKTLDDLDVSFNRSKAAGERAAEKIAKEEDIRDQLNSKLEGQLSQASQGDTEARKLKDESNKLDKQIVAEKKKIRQASAAGVADTSQLKKLETQRRTLTRKINQHANKQDKLQADITKTKNDIKNTNRRLKTATSRVTKEAEAQARINKDITASTKARSSLAQRQTQLGERRGAISGKRQSIGQGLGGAAAFAGPMLIASMEEAMFKGMERANMTREQRATQGAIQGAQEGIAISGMIAMFVPGGPFIKVITVAMATAVKAFLGFRKAAELTFEEVNQKFSQIADSARADSSAAQNILQATRTIRESGGDERIIKEQSALIQTEFSKIKNVDLAAALSKTSGSVSAMGKVIDDFNQKQGGFGRLQDITTKLSELQQKQGGGTTVDIQSLAQGLGSSLSKNNEQLTKRLQNLITNDRASGETAIGKVFDFQEVATRRTTSTNKLSDTSFKDTTETNTVRSASKETSNVINDLIEGFVDDANLVNNAAKSEARENLKKLFAEVVFGVKDLEEVIGEGGKITNKAANRLFTFLQAFDKGSKQAKKIAVSSEKLGREAGSQQEIIDRTIKTLRDNRRTIEKTLRGDNFTLKLATEVEKFRNSIVDNLFDNRAEKFQFEDQRIRQQSNLDSKQFGAENAEAFRAEINTAFGESVAAKELVERLSKQFQSGGEGIDAALATALGGLSGKELGPDIDAALKNVEDRQKIIDTLTALKDQRDIQKEVTQQQLRNNELARQIEDVKFDNAVQLGKVQDQLFVKSQAFQQQLSKVDLDLQTTLDQIDLRMSDPLNQVGGVAGIRREADADRERLRAERKAIEQRAKIEQEQAILQATSDANLLIAMGLQEAALKNNSDIITDSTTSTERNTQAIELLPGKIVDAINNRKPGPASDLPKTPTGGTNVSQVSEFAQDFDELEKTPVSKVKVGAAPEELRVDAALMAENLRKLTSDLRVAAASTNPADQIAAARLSAIDRGLDPNVANALTTAFRKVIPIQNELNNSLQNNTRELEKRNAQEEQSEAALEFKAGTEAFGKSLDDETAGFARKLGEEVPSNFRDGMTQALSAIVNQTDNLGDTLLGIANSFLQTVQQAFLQQASGKLMQNLGFGNTTGFASGGYVGNGSRVPAMLTNGEYVMSREAVQRLGTGGMDQLNKGTLSMAGFAKGGAVGNKSRAAYSQHINTFGSAFDDSKSAQFFSEFYDSVPKATREISLQAAADQEAQAEIQARQAKKKQLMSTIVSLAASAALAFGAKKIGNFVKTKRGAAGKTIRASWGADIALEGNNWVNKGPPLSPANQERLAGLNTYMHQNGLGLRDEKGTASLIGKAINAKHVYQGGPIQAYAGGGQVRGPAGRDVIPAVLTEGEYVIKASSARKYGKRFLDNLNYGSQGYYNGGATGPMPVGGSQNFNLNMNFDVASGQTESQQGQGQSNGQKGQDQNINQFAQNIRKLVQEEIQKEQRAGGLLRGTRR